MKLSVLANLYGGKTLDEALKIISGLGVHTVEIGAGGYPGKAHCNPAELLADEAKFNEYVNTFKKYDEETEARVSHPAEASAPAAVQSVGSGSVLRADNSEKDSSIKFRVMKPKSFEDVSLIADQLIAGCTVVFNAELLDMETRQKMLLFLNGVTYTTDGDISHVSQNTYIITPHDVDVSDEG